MEISSPLACELPVVEPEKEQVDLYDEYMKQHHKVVHDEF